MTKPMSTGACAKYSGLNYRTIHRWVVDGFRGKKLKATRNGKKWMIEKNDFSDFLSKIKRFA